MKKTVAKQTLLLMVLALVLAVPMGLNPVRAENGLQILKARYGAGQTYRDVTSIVQGFVRNQAISLKVSNENLWTDPAPGIAKEMVVVFLRHGETRTLHIPEGSWFIIPRPEGEDQPTHHGIGKLEIIRALYGSGGTYRIVTGVIQSQVYHNQINMRVTNENLGGDPTPNREKELLVIYRKQNREYGAHLREGRWFIVID